VPRPAPTIPIRLTHSAPLKKLATVDELRALAAPDVSHDSPRLPGKFSTYKLKVELRSMKIEDDSDIHLVIADPTNASRTR
jgi:hypothetical protein